MMNFFLLSLFACCLVVSWDKRQKTKEQNKSCWCRQRDVCDVMHGLNLQWGSVMQLRQSWLVNSNATSNFTKGASLCTYSYKWAGNNCKKARRKEALTLSDKFKSFFYYINKLANKLTFLISQHKKVWTTQSRLISLGRSTFWRWSFLTRTKDVGRTNLSPVFLG